MYIYIYIYTCTCNYVYKQYQFFVSKTSYLMNQCTVDMMLHRHNNCICRQGLLFLHFFLYVFWGKYILHHNYYSFSLYKSGCKAAFQVGNNFNLVGCGCDMF